MLIASGLPLDDAIWLGVNPLVLDMMGFRFDPEPTLQIVCGGDLEIVSQEFV